MRKSPSLSGRRPPSFRNNVFSPGKGLRSPKKYMFQIFLQSQSFHFFFIWYCDLSLERFWEELQLCRRKYFNQNSYVKVTIKQKFEHICSLEKLKFFLLKGHDFFPKEFLFKVAPWNNLSSFFLGTWLFLEEKPTSPLKHIHMFWIF